MEDNTRLLEDLVARAVARLDTLTRERDRLQQEVHQLQDDLQAPEADSGNGERAWLQRRYRVASALRETLTELRGE